MSIYKLNSQDTTTHKIELINDFTIENSGKISQSNFNKNELDVIYNDLGLSRQYLRNQLIGNTLSTYTGWTHLIAESGYSIWKFSPTSYTYNALNELYFDDKLLVNKGLANSESASSFDSVFLYNGDSGAGYTDDTTEASSETGTEFDLMNSTSDYLYVGDASTFSGAKFEFQTRGSNYTLKVEYYNGGAWTELTANLNALDDDTNDFESDGKISWTVPTDWATVEVNSSTKYYVRISTTTTPITVAKAYYIVPGDSVIGLLALSSTQIQNEEWSWCSYGTSIYVTIRNMGSSTYEGNSYITSSSTTTNKQNFFIYNHEYKASYESSLYDYEAIKIYNISDKVDTITANSGLSSHDAGIFVDASSSSITIGVPSAVGMKGKTFFIKCKDIGSGLSVTLDPMSGETIDGASTYSMTTDYAKVTIISDGSNWLTI